MWETDTNTGLWHLARAIGNAPQNIAGSMYSPQWLTMLSSSSIYCFGKIRYSPDDSPFTTELTLEEGAAGKTDVSAIIVMDGISGAEVSQSHPQCRVV